MRFRKAMCSKNAGLAVAVPHLEKRCDKTPGDDWLHLGNAARGFEKAASERAGTAKPAFLQHIVWRSLLNRD